MIVGGGWTKQKIDERVQIIRAAFKSDADLRERLWNRQSGTCVICKIGLPYSTDPFLTVDHCHPVIQYAGWDLTIEEATRRANDEAIQTRIIRRT
jgi:hypothetical protein